MLTKTILGADDVAKMLSAAEAEARAHHWAVTIAICDDGGHLLALDRKSVV